MDFFTFTKRFQFTYDAKIQLKQLSYIIKNSDFRYLKSVPKMQLQTEINKFWSKNNPNSQYGKNQFQRIFYRRIIYADKKFTVRGYMPGWKTDRGRIYVKYGKPDEVSKENINNINIGVIYKTIDEIVKDPKYSNNQIAKNYIIKKIPNKNVSFSSIPPHKISL